MKKVIGGALYNTDTARCIGAWEPNGNDRRNISYISESLYRTRSGKYFIHGEGGAMSKYAVSIGNNSWGWGEHIEPLSAESARKWAKEHLDAETYAAEFGMPEEAGNDKVPLNLTVLASTKAKLEQRRSETGKSISSLIDELVSKL